MTADELKDWLGKDESAGAGWSKSDGSGETVGHDRYVHQKPLETLSSLFEPTPFFEPEANGRAVEGTL